jgi:hypothetical protein
VEGRERGLPVCLMVPHSKLFTSGASSFLHVWKAVE